MLKLWMKNYNAIFIEKQQKYQHYCQVILIYEYLAGEEILPSDQSRIIEQAKFSKQVEALDVFKPVTTKLKTKDAISENALSQEAINKLNKIKDIEKRYT